jgi:hypothetical protein
MARPAVDPDRPNIARLTTKVPDADADYLAELARSAGITKSELFRRILQERLKREKGPPDGGQPPTTESSV